MKNIGSSIRKGGKSVDIRNWRDLMESTDYNVRIPIFHYLWSESSKSFVLESVISFIKLGL